MCAERPENSGAACYLYDEIEARLKNHLQEAFAGYKDLFNIKLVGITKFYSQKRA